MAAEDEILFIESVDGVDGPLACEDVTTNSSDMESVLWNLAACWRMRYCSLQLYKLKLHFGNHKIKLQFAVNDGLPVDLENPQML